MATIDYRVGDATPDEEHRVWDLPVRVFHWTLALAFSAAFMTNRLGVAYFKYHVWCGYVVLVLILFRIIWGIVGTKHARFSNFIYGPRATLSYAVKLIRGRDGNHAGHNPLGAWMIITLLGALGVQAILGLFADDEIFNTGPLTGYVSHDFSLRLTSVHRYLFYWIAAFVTIHIVAVIAHSLFKRENLVWAMMTGRKPSPSASSYDAIHSSRTWLAILLTIALSAGLAWIISEAPIPNGQSSVF